MKPGACAAYNLFLGSMSGATFFCCLSKQVDQTFRGSILGGPCIVFMCVSFGITSRSLNTLSSRRHVKVGETFIRLAQFGDKAEIAEDVTCFDVNSQYATCMKDTKFPGMGTF